MKRLWLPLLGISILSCSVFTTISAPPAPESAGISTGQPEASPTSTISGASTPGSVPTTDSTPTRFISILGNLWMPKGDTKINCVNNPSEGINEQCDDLVYGGTWTNVPGVGFCREHADWTITLWNNSILADKNTACPGCETQARFPNALSGEFTHDITTGHLTPGGDLVLSAVYQEGPVSASGSLHSCEASSVVSGSWNLGIADGLSFIKPVRIWLESWKGQ